MSHHRCLDHPAEDSFAEADLVAFLADQLPSVRLYSPDAAASLEAAVTALDGTAPRYAANTRDQRSLASLSMSLIYALPELDEGSMPERHVKNAIQVLLAISTN